MNLFRYWEWLLENIPGVEEKKVFNFTAQSFYLRKRIEGGQQFEIYGKMVNRLIEVEFEHQGSVERAVDVDSMQEIRSMVEMEQAKRNKVLLSLQK